jgi:hypothetical protein
MLESFRRIEYCGKRVEEVGVKMTNSVTYKSVEELNMPCGSQLLNDNNLDNDKMSEQKNSIQKVCPECDCTKFEHDFKRAETCCLGCGLVLEGPPAYSGGLVRIQYPWRYTFDPIAKDQRGREGSVFETDYHNINSNIFFNHYRTAPIKLWSYNTKY